MTRSIARTGESTAADRPVLQRPGARLLVVDGDGRFHHAPRRAFVDFLRPRDLVVANVHEPGTSHYELLRAFMDDAALGQMLDALAAHGCRTHEFGDSVLIDPPTFPTGSLTDTRRA